jgi:predicted enzyme related to lactoylglutathione lyase
MQEETMKNLISFFEIPSTDFNRAILFYTEVLNVQIKSCENSEGKMAFFPKDQSGLYGAIIKCEGFEPSSQGILISFNGGDDLSNILSKVDNAGGKVVIPKTRIQAEDEGYFAVFIDTEGNRIGLYSKN